jgi:PAS domain S-box-containing protein
MTSRFRRGTRDLTESVAENPPVPVVACDESGLLAARVLEHLAAPVCVIDSSSGALVYTNASWNRMFGYHDREALGAHVGALHAPPDEAAPGQQLRAIMRALDHEGMWSGRLHCARKDGSRFWCTTTVTKFADGAGGEGWVIAYPPPQMPAE